MLLYPPQIVYTNSSITYVKCEDGCYFAYEGFNWRILHELNK